MLKGCLAALAACFIWGLIFVIPKLIEDFGSLEITLGRYLFYGIWSLAIFCLTTSFAFSKYGKKVWLMALWFGLVANILYYAGIVFSVKHACPAVCALIIGISPITIALYGNLVEKTIDFKRLILPSVLIVTGLLVINWPNFQTIEGDVWEYVLGLALAGFALGSWSWYVVANARFLKKHPEVCLREWPSLIGMGTLIWAVLFGALWVGFMAKPEDLQRFVTWDETLHTFLLGTAALGIVCAWFGLYLWNIASITIPVSLAGQLTIFETIFGLLFVFILEERLPTVMESSGIALILVAVWYGLRIFIHREHPEQLPN